MSRHHTGRMKQIPFRRPSSISRHRKKIQPPWRPGDLATWRPGDWDLCSPVLTLCSYRSGSATRPSCPPMGLNGCLYITCIFSPPTFVPEVRDVESLCNRRSITTLHTVSASRSLSRISSQTPRQP
jgi:hypothetical protein